MPSSTDELADFSQPKEPNSLMAASVRGSVRAEAERVNAERSAAARAIQERAARELRRQGSVAEGVLSRCPTTVLVVR